MPEALISDTEAMRQIHQLLDKREWEVEDLDSIADIVRYTGREIRDSGDVILDESP